MDDDDGFEGYVEMTIDAGPWLNLGTALFCVLLIVLFPCIVSVGRRYEKWRMGVAPDNFLETTQDENDDDYGGVANECDEGVEAVVSSCKENVCDNEDSSESSSSYSSCKWQSSDKNVEELTDTNSHLHDNPTTLYEGPDFGDMVGNQVQTLFDKLFTPPYPDEMNLGISESRGQETGRPETVLDIGAAKRNRRTGVRRYQRGLKEKQWKQEKQERREEKQFDSGEAFATFTAFTHSDDARYATSYPSDEIPESHDAVKISDMGPVVENFAEVTLTENMVLSPSDAVDAHDPGAVVNQKVPMEGENLDLLHGEHAWWRPSTMAAGFDRLLEIAEWDREMKRIMSLSIPFSLAAVADGAFETIRVALVANFIGTDAVGAYTIVLLVLGLTEEFFGGFALTSASLCSQAVGSKNYSLAGEYVQISCILFSLCMVPNVLVWMFLTDDVVRLFGFNEATSQLAQEYARYCVLTLWVKGLDESYGSLLCVIDHERFYTFMSILDTVVATCIILALVLTEPPTLAEVGLVELGSKTFFFLLVLVITTCAGWMKKYTNGVFKTNALRNTVTVKTVAKTAVPLALGQLLEYGEWEVLTIFVAALGPAEVTTWGIIGSLWDTLEMLTEGFGDAGEIRTGFHLGAARPAQARTSSYKTMLVAFICSTLFTSLLWILGEDLASWMTPDHTLQSLIVKVLPLIGIGNIALTAGSVSWALVGSQGRYRLATLVAFVSSWCLTLPLATLFIYGFRFDLQGPVSAVVIGYSVTGTCLQYILVRSDWTRLSKIIVDRNGGVELDSSPDSSSDSSPPDSSSDYSASSSDREKEKMSRYLPGP